ncbi:hypothetical protein D0812_22075 [Vibrio owensii]|uniref:Uncharacterized protein n=1 Tax=Vibrio owensii TaxID=696485 RepID=A0AAP9KC40_9VIBR|nr:hypothetical protein [Vibrio owensii]AYO17079.1 hypothetical protein D0812_22075 [Vibrio owensii]QGH49226.1 hypothetical protein APZ19_19090 [Vibrio owensii]
MKITLDASAVRELFPEDSEARVQLSQAVIAEYARKTLPKYLDQHLRDHVELIANDALKASINNDDFKAGITEALDEYMQTRFPSLQMLHSGKRKIREETRKVAAAQITDSIHDILSDELGAIRDSIKTQVAEIAPQYLGAMHGDYVSRLVETYSANAIKKAYQSLEKNMLTELEKFKEYGNEQF